MSFYFREYPDPSTIRDLNPLKDFKASPKDVPNSDVSEHPLNWIVRDFTLSLARAFIPLKIRATPSLVIGVSEKFRIISLRSKNASVT
jgi:hypothetical protein